MGERLGRSFYRADASDLATRLLGQRLVRILDDGTRLAGLIHETEAYLGVEDAASHAYRGRRTARNEGMYAREGTAYVYFTYGMHFCINVVAGRVDHPHAVLIRALLPEEGLERMLENRGGKEPLCKGPARLCKALGIDGAMNLQDLVEGERLFIERGMSVPPRGRVACPRVGIGQEGEWVVKPLRWYVRESPWVSVRDRAAEGAAGLKGQGRKCRR
ncbi:MAG: DNA-3-methyladenine glycosylase [Phycisphaerales bacterium]|nr:DNA-3-methyladenine glycosylase [Phycisphaerales bacterium]